MDEPTPRATPNEASPVGAGRPRRRRRWGRGVLLGLFLLGLLLGVAGALLVKSRTGQRMVIDAVLAQARKALAGSLTVAEVRGSNLLGGATLVGVTLDAEGGRDFLHADSVRVRYSVFALVGAPIRIRSVTVYGPRIEINRYPGEEGLNITRLLPLPSDTGERAPGRGVTLGSLRVVGGSVEVLTPLEGEATERILTAPAPGGDGTLRRLAFTDLNLLLEEVVLDGPGGDVLEARLATLAMGVHLLDRPVTVTHAEGLVRFGDEGFDLSDGIFRLPGSAFDGSVSAGPTEGGDGAWSIGLELRTRGPAALSDLGWIDDRLPDGVFRGDVSIVVSDGLDVGLRDVHVEMEASRLALDGGIRVAEEVELLDLEIRAGPLALAHLRPWLDRDLPVSGWLSGNLNLSGTARSMATVGRVTLVPTGFGGGPTTADGRGTLHFVGDPGVTGLVVALDPLNLELARAFQPDLRLQGRASARVDASGRVSSGVRFAADFRQEGPAVEASRVLVEGVARHAAGESWFLDARGDVTPLSLALLGQVVPGLASEGTVSGSVDAVGNMSSMKFTGDLLVGGGTVEVEGTLDLESRVPAYRLYAVLGDVRLSNVMPALPDPVRWTGRAEIEGVGFAPDSAEARGTLHAWSSRVGGVQVDTLAAGFTLGSGILNVDTLTGRVAGFQVDGEGDVGLVEGGRGELRLAFRTDDLVGLRPLFMGETVTARDTLSALESQLLRLQGVDADTLPLLADVAMSGVLDGDLLFVGNLTDLGLKGGVRLRNGVYGADSIGAFDVHLDGRDLTGPERRLDLAVEGREIRVLGRAFSAMDGRVSLDGRTGDGAMNAVQDTGEEYSMEGAFALDSVGGGEFRLARMVLDLDSLAWALSRPTVITWDSSSVTLEGVELTRGGDEPMALRAVGTLAWRGDSDLHVSGEALQVSLLARVAQWQGAAAEGRLDLSLDIAGDAADPTIEGWFKVREPRFGDLSLSSLDGEIRYAHQVAEVKASALQGERQVFRLGGTVPVDLALRGGTTRVVDRAMDVRVEADSMDAALVLSTLTFMENVEGVVFGDFHIGGPLNRPAPSGILTLREAAWSIEAVGVRHSRVTGSLTLNPDRSIDVALDGRAGGTLAVRGQVILDPLTDPRLDLTIGLQGFEAVNRRDLTGVLSGELRLLGSYGAPRVEGSLSVDQGTLFLEEFVRSAEVVDLTDPRIFQVVDTTALSTHALLAGIRNPFLQNLRVDVDLSVPRDTWLRSEDMNVEIGGNLLVRYDRMSRDIVMVGELQALRGSYNVLGRRFDVRGGTVIFTGTPGVNPTLNIQAVSRIRRMDGEPLDVTASVQGTLTQLRVNLTSPDQGIVESDLVSYLIFGRPSHELATGQETLIGGAAGSFVGAATGAGVNYLSGTLAARLGAALSQQIGLDYLSISQAGDFGVLSGSLGSSFAGTQVEVGQYLGERLFVVLIFRPLTGQNSGQSFFGGARVELALTEDYTLQAFWEDRFLRSRVGGFGDLGLQASQVVGVFVFREWGY